MTRATLKRVEKLEQTMATTAEAWSGKGHWLVGKSREELDAKEAALRASPEWQGATASCGGASWTRRR